MCRDRVSWPHVRPAHPNPTHRGRKALLLPSTRPRRAHRKHRPPAHPPQPRPPLRHPQHGMAAVVRTRRGHPERPGAGSRRWSARRRGGSPAHRRPVGRPWCGRAVQPTDRRAAGRRGLVAPGAAPQRRRGAGRPLGVGETGPAGPARPRRQRRVARRGRRRHHRALGPAGLRAGDAPLVAAAQRSRRVARHRLRDGQRDAALPRLGRLGEASPGDRGAPVRPGDGAVRPPADGDPLRPDQHVLRRRGGPAAAGATRALEGEAHRLPPADPGPGARRQRLRAPLAGLRRQTSGNNRRWPACSGRFRRPGTPSW